MKPARKPSKRQIALDAAKYAGYHDDSTAWTRLVVENRVNRQAMIEAFQSGRRLREAGMKCGCSACKQSAV
jgi:hypothetical protein